MRFRPFVLKCPQCMAPTESGASKCRYCDVPLQWEPERPIDRDDFFFREPEYVPPAVDNAFHIGFGPNEMRGGSVNIFTAQPQLMFKGSRLVIPERVAECVQVESLIIGRNFQAFQNSLPGSVFTPNAVGIELGLEVCVPGIIISLGIKNLTALPLTFTAVLLGTRVEYSPPRIESAYRDRMKLPTGIEARVSDLRRRR